MGEIGNKKKLVFKIGFILVCLGVVNYFFRDLISLESIQASQLVLSEKIGHYPILSSISFILIFVITTSLSLPLIGLLSLTAGFLFPLSWALALVYFSFFWHCFIMIKLIRGLFKDIIETKFKKKFNTLYSNIQKKGLYYVIFLRVSLVTPSFIVNCASSFTSLNATSFSLVSLISSIPVLSILVISGKKLGSINSLLDLYSHTNLIILLSLAFLALLLVIYQNKSK